MNEPAASRPDFETLAVYNAEAARGIVHTPAWQARMAALQAEFDERVRDALPRYRGPGGGYVFPARMPSMVWDSIRRVLARDSR